MDKRGRARANETGKKRTDVKKQRGNETGRDDNRYIRIRFWNIAGLASTSKEEWVKIESSDIVGLSETWTEKGRDKTIKGKLRNHMVIEKMATRKKKKGRAIGGMLMAVNNKLEWRTIGEENEEQENKEVIAGEVKVGNRKWIIISVYMNEQKEVNWERIENILENNPGAPVIIGGDFNARTAKEGGRARENGKRNSRDKILNTEGRELLKRVNRLGLHIVNGDTEDDEEGKFTYIGGGVIDYVLTNEAGRDWIRNMIVEDTLESDHVPLTITLEVEHSIIAGKQGNEEKEYIDWSEEATEKYRKRMNKMRREGEW